MKISGTGALVGAAVGGLARAAAVGINIGEGVLWLFVLPSAAVGVLVGLIAGGMGKPLIGAFVGALLSAVVFEFFMLPCASLFGTIDQIAVGGKAGGESAFLQATLLYAVEMGIAGFLAGGAGGLAGRHTQRVETISARVAEEPKRRIDRKVMTSDGFTSDTAASRSTR